MNIVCTGDGRFIEVQGTAEGAPFTREQMDDLLELGREASSSLSGSSDRQLKPPNSRLGLKALARRQQGRPRGI